MAPLIVDTKDVVFIKPSKSIPSSILSLSTLDNRPDLNMLCHIIHVYQSQNNDGYPNDQIDPNPINVLKEALSKALSYYYPLAGKLVKHDDGKFRVHYNSNDGVPFIEANANCNLSSLHYLDSSEDMKIAKDLAFEPPSQDDQNGHQCPIIGFKVTKFLCGGFTIGIGASHVVCDGFGVSQFLHAVIELARGKSEPSIKPVWDRHRLMGSITKTPLPSPIDNHSAAVSPYLPTTTLIHECFKVDGESIKKLKTSLTKELFNNQNNIKTMNEIVTNFEALSSYIWRAKAKALKLNYDGKTMLGILVGARRHVDPPLPEGYYGNAIVDANVVLTVKELVEKPLSEVVKHIKEIKKVAFTRNYIVDSINTLETKEQDYNVEGIGAYFNLTDWKHLGFMENMDFGGNVLVNFLPAPCNMFAAVDLCIFAPPCKLDYSSIKDGGIRVFVSLPSAAMAKFREEMEALAYIS
ncbi:hypothetical protein PIB30_031293 [Stylosanthes scabra]|uniref:Uncharacterized protein n=1 Tax=Stylosanthes scabra TaxID=79078 RepID=A0ABU6ZBV3_9FABA|nr:hypothetical protein [Stylosanthes scabra]